MADDKEKEKLVTPEEKMQDQQRRAAVEAEENKDAPKLDETIPGGRYMLDDGETLVNANGEPIDKDGKVKK